MPIFRRIIHLEVGVRLAHPRVRRLWRFRGEDLQLFAITKPGLLGIAASVLALWGCIAAEKATIRTGQRDAIASYRQLQRLRESVLPVSHPVPAVRSRPVTL